MLRAEKAAMPARAMAIIACVARLPAAKAAVMSSKIGTGRPGCGTQNIRYMKKVTVIPPAPRAARKWSGE